MVFAPAQICTMPFRHFFFPFAFFLFQPFSQQRRSSQKRGRASLRPAGSYGAAQGHLPKQQRPREWRNMATARPTTNSSSTSTTGKGPRAAILMVASTNLCHHVLNIESLFKVYNRLAVLSLVRSCSQNYSI